MSETNDQTQEPAAATPPNAEPQQSPAGEAAQPSSGEGQQAPAGDVLDTGADAGAQQEPAGDVLSADDDTQREGVPDSYTFEAPEGVQPDLITEEQLGSFMELAKEQKLTQAQFQGIMKAYAERTQASVNEAVDAWNNRVEGWRESARNDKEFGGEDYNANVATALKAVEAFGDADFKAMLKSPSPDNPEGLAIGNHPAVLRFLNRIGKKLGDPSLVQGDAQKQDSSDEARLKRLYPSMFKESA